MPRYGLKRLVLLLLLPLAAAAVIWAARFPELVEQYYSLSVYGILSPAIASLTGLLPFSIGELFLVAGIIALLIYTTHTVYRIATAKGRRFYAVYTYFVNLCVIAAVLYAGFVFLCGLNYYREPFAAAANLTVRESSTEELTALCSQLVTIANKQSKLVEADEAGVTVLSSEYPETAQHAVAAMKSISKQYPFMRGLYAPPKPVLLSSAMSYSNISGVYFPYTFEANVNIDIPDFYLPATMCHELAHQRGYMSEDEANFISYLACKGSDNPDFNYSGTLHALLFSLNALYKADKTAYNELYTKINDRIKADYAYYNSYWARYEGAVSQVSATINDTYLKANNQTDGVQSYGRIVDLLLAEYRAENNLV